jgi:WD40 repeat protein
MSTGAAAASDSGVEASLVLELGAHAGPVRRISVSRDQGIVATASDDKTARIWDLATGRLIHTLRPAAGEGDVGRLYGVAIHPREPVVAVGGTTAGAPGGRLIHLFDTKSGRLLRSFDARGDDIKRLAWSSDGTVLLAAYAGHHGMRAFDREGRELFADEFKGASYGLAVAANGLVAATSMSGQVHLYQVGNGQVSALKVLSVGGQRAVSAAFAPDGTQLVIGFYHEAVAVEPQVIDVQSGALMRKLAAPQLQEGDLRTVAWSPDGRLIHAGGSGARAGYAYPVFSFDAQSGRLVATHVLARNSITDLADVVGSSFVYGSFDGSWGIASDRGPTLQIASPIPDHRDASHLLIDPIARTVAWTFDLGGKTASFDLSSRVVSLTKPDSVQPPRMRRGLFTRPLNWENHARPEVAGRLVPLAADEVSRAFTYIGDTSDGALGTSRALYRIDAAGQITWRTPSNTEVRSVNSSADGRLLVTSMSDGTVRWWRASDGAQLLTLFAARDGRWIMWTPNGYFDASAGADGLAGWAVSRGNQPVSDFFSLGRFRDKLHRGDVIDRLFATLDVATAVAEANRAVVAASQSATAMQSPPQAESQAAATTPSEPVAPPREQESARVEAISSPAAVVSPIEHLPPVVSALGATVLRAIEPAVELPFTLHSRTSGADVILELRIDGRPAEARALVMPEKFDGTSRGAAQVSVPDSGAVVQMIARNSNGFSEPLTFVIERPPVAPAPAAQPAPQAEAVRDEATAAVGLPTTPAAVVGADPAPLPIPSPAASASAAPGVAAAPSAPAPAPPRAGPPRPRLFVLAIGISDYQRKEYRLGLAAKDARDFSAALEKQAGMLYADVSVRTLTNSDATRDAILKGLEWLARSVGANDIGMLFLAGHGLNDAGGRYYFLPHEGNHERLATTAVSESSVRETLGKMRGKALLFIDTCFAGNALGSFRSASRELARLANELASSENGVVVFASSSGRQLSEENDEWGNGAFTKSVIEGMSGKADLTRTGRITFKALDFYVSEEVRRLTSGRQTPVTISPAGVPDFTVARVI